MIEASAESVGARVNTAVDKRVSAQIRANPRRVLKQVDAEEDTQHYHTPGICAHFTGLETKHARMPQTLTGACSEPGTESAPGPAGE